MNMELPQHFKRLQLPFSWHVAAELCWRVPGHTIYETAPGGGHYDCLSIRGARLRVDIVRGGSIHAHAGLGQDDRPPVPLEEVRELSVRADGVDLAVARVLQRYGLVVEKRHPPTTAENLTYRVAAAALSTHFFRADWDCRALVAADDFAVMPVQPPAPDLSRIPANQVWALVLKGEPQTYLARGWAVTADGERLNLLAAYDGGATVESLAERLTATPSARTSDVALLGSSDAVQSQPTWPTDL